MSIMMLHLLLSVIAAVAAEENVTAYYGSPSMATRPQGIRSSTIRGSHKAWLEG